jgi:exoribonuclease-2
MNVFYEEKGTFKVGIILSSNITSLQVETPYGKRSKIKITSVLLRFDEPLVSVFMDCAKKLADDIDINFLWECCNCDIEFNSNSLATEYFGHSPSPVEAAAVLIKLHSAPMYFYKRGKGCYKSAPPLALKAALVSQKKKQYQAEQQSRYTQYLESFILPEEFKPLLPELLYKPDKSSVEWKALNAACTSTKLSLLSLLDKCGAIPSSHDYHLHRFHMDYFPNGVEFNMPEYNDKELSNTSDLPIADVVAFSIDDADTTEIDDAFSVTSLSLGSFRIGIHIAAPSLGIIVESPLDITAAQRLSTVYFPGNKITMLPENVIRQYTLGEKRLCSTVSMYLEVADDFTVTSISSRVEQVRIAANLRRDTLEKDFNEMTLARNDINCVFGQELKLLWNFACKMELSRGKANDSNNEKIDYGFSVKDGTVTIKERRRDSPIDKLVSELMIFVNTEWGKQLANGGVAGIYRNQSGGKVRMSTSPAPHQGLGVSQYAWCSSPMRRYVDLINQRQLISLLHGEKPPHPKECNNLLISIRNFEEAYDAYNEFQRKMEKYWCLCWLLQKKIKTTTAVVIRENYVKLDYLPLIIRVPSLPEIFPETFIELEILQINLLELTVKTKFTRKLET